MGILSRFGVGNATVDLLVPDTVRQGQTVDATVAVEGGSDTQEVEKIYARLRSKFYGEDTNSTWTIAEYTLLEEGFTIEPSTSEEYPVSLYVPETTPPTTVARSSPPVWIDTGLDVEMAVDPDDRDNLAVEPGGRFARVHEAVTDHLGFRASETEVVQGSGFGFGNYVTELEYKTTRGTEYDLDELELKLVSADQTGLELGVEVDRPGVSLLGSDEEHSTLTIGNESSQQIAQQFRRLME